MVKKGWSLRCESIEWMTPAGLEQANVAYMYYIIKVTDLLDTIFFILRKKNNQATFLHVYHHFMTAFVTFLVVKLVPGNFLLYTYIFKADFLYYLLYYRWSYASYRPFKLFCTCCYVLLLLLNVL